MLAPRTQLGQVREGLSLVQSAVTHVHRTQKALVQMNLQLSTVITDITGVTRLRILRESRHDRVPLDRT